VKLTPHALPLDCASAGRLIDAYLLDALDDVSGAALRTHLTGCTACSTELHGITRLVGALGTLPEPAASPDLDQRIIAAAIAERRRRHEHRSWLGDLPRLIFRGAMRTTGTLVVTLVSVALLGAVFVFAAGNLFTQTALGPPKNATMPPAMTPTAAPTPRESTAPSPAPTEASKPVVVSATPTPGPTLGPTPTPALTPGPTLAPPPTAEPTLAPTPTPTEKPKRTPTPPPAPTDTPAPTAGTPIPSP
jgi:hypothetical protein